MGEFLIDFFAGVVIGLLFLFLDRLFGGDTNGLIYGILGQLTWQITKANI